VTYRSRFFALLLPFALLAFTPHVEHSLEVVMSPAEQELRSLLATYETSLNAGDAARIEHLYAEDGVFMPAGFPTASGRSAVRGAYDAVFANIRIAIHFTVDELTVKGGCRVCADSLGGHLDRRRHGSERAREEPGALHFCSRLGRLEDRSLYVQQRIMTKRIRVGIIGANPDRGWAAQAHIPALQSLPDDFEITALSTSRRESAAAAGKRFGVPLAFDNHEDLVNRADVDVVAITVKVPYHFELATAALTAGKAVYCEWPLGNGLREAEKTGRTGEEERRPRRGGACRPRAAPAVLYVRDLVRQGYVGEVLSTTLIGSGMGWGPTIEPYNVYMSDRKNGATLLAIALGHAADAAVLLPRRGPRTLGHDDDAPKSFTIAGTDESTPMKTDDQVSVTGLLEGGAALSIHYRGGRSRGTNLLWEINGTEGDLQVTADGGQAQIFDLTVRGGNGVQSSLEGLPVPPPIPVLAAARSWHQRRPSVRAFRARLSRGERISLPRSTTRSRAIGCWTGSRRRRQPTASNARLIRREHSHWLEMFAVMFAGP